jgi:DNA ligase D-like protein (predicted polymerase)/DNA ligase D-like protein (predicted 3'-phosphoesterase)
MSLKAYNDKRDFTRTSEPEQADDPNTGALKFVVQRHQASTLHYDFRLEMDGVLKSWAVPKGPSLNPGDKRLAMMVEDHPFSYRTFQGDIPEGNYGAGHVDIWDEGRYHAAGAPGRKTGEKALREGLEKGSFSFVLQGRKLQGEFSLVAMKGRQKNAWLLVKKADAFATQEAYDAEDHAAGATPATPKPSEKKKPARAAAAKPAAEKPAARAKNETARRIGGHQVRLTSLDKLYWPEEKITKKDLIGYYQAIAPVLLPYLKDRAESLLRHPQGIQAPGFFQKDIQDALPDWVETADIHAESTDAQVRYIVCQNAATLAYMNNLGCIQLNPWNSRLQHLDQPDWAVIDLDPGENTYDDVVEVALAVKEVADAIGVPCYPKTSGATGMHLYFPLGGLYPFALAKDFAYRIARQVHQRLPQLTSLERMPKERRYLVYLDYLQNAIGQTMAAPYCVRPRPGATVSAPLRWDEVKKGLEPSQFTMHNMPARLKKQGDLFRDILGKGIDLEAKLADLKKLY